MGQDDVSQAFFQPFLVHTRGILSLGVNSGTTANWTGDDGQKYTVPINVFASKLTRIGPFPFSIQGGAGYYVQTPDNGPDWQLRMVFVVLLPKGRRPAHRRLSGPACLKTPSECWRDGERPLAAGPGHLAEEETHVA